MAASERKARRSVFCQALRRFGAVLIPMLWLGAALLLWKVGMYHTSTGVELSIGLALVLMVTMLGQTPLRKADLLILYPVFVMETVFVYRTPFVMVYAPARVLFLLLDLMLLLWYRCGGVRKHFLGLSITGLSAGILSFCSDAFFRKLIPWYYKIGARFGLDAVQKAMLLVAAALVLLGVYCLAIRLLAAFLRRKKPALERTSRRFYELEPFLLVLVVFTLLLWYVLGYVSFLGSIEASRLFSRYFNLTLILLFSMDAVYIVLLVKAASINEKMQLARKDQSLLSAYNTELEETMDSLHEIRHDAKNLLLTMGGFVERSGDPEMKEFYQKNIVPFMEHTLAKNDLQNKLKILKDDCLKSFLYYKLLEKTEQGIPVSLELTDSFSLEKGYGDVIRLLGIFLDNAAEEAACACGGIGLKIWRTGEGIRIGISNPVRPEVRETGVVAGRSQKGPGRGNGLLIAKKIIAGYDNMLLNSYFTEYGFTQSLLIAER